MTTPRGTKLRTATAARRIEPDPRRLVAAVAMLYLEVEAGRRPVTQIRPLVSPAVYERLVAPRRGERGQRCGPAADAVRTIHLTLPAPGAIEASVVVEQGRRTLALAIRMERHVGRWRAVELCRPEAGEPPRRTASLPHVVGAGSVA